MKLPFVLTALVLCGCDGDYPVVVKVPKSRFAITRMGEVSQPGAARNIALSTILDSDTGSEYLFIQELGGGASTLVKLDRKLPAEAPK